MVYSCITLNYNKTPPHVKNEYTNPAIQLQWPNKTSHRFLSIATQAAYGFFVEEYEGYTTALAKKMCWSLTNRCWIG